MPSAIRLAAGAASPTFPLSLLSGKVQNGYPCHYWISMTFFPGSQPSFMGKWRCNQSLLPAITVTEMCAPVNM